jgi:hypothetical protein
MENVAEQQPNISLKDTEEVKCTCGSALFQQAISLRRVSALLTGTGKDEYVPVSIIVCMKCDTMFERPKIIS